MLIITRRGRNTSYADHVVNFELLLEEAEKAGARFNNVMKSNHLLRTARLSRNEEQWVLQPMSGDLNQYNAIRAALRRLPWHPEGGQQKGPEAYPVHQASHNVTSSNAEPFNLSQQSRLNPVPNEGQNQGIGVESHYIGDEQEDVVSESSEDSDYFSTASEANSDDLAVWASSWAIHNKHQKKLKRPHKSGSDKKSGGKGKGN